MIPDKGHHVKCVMRTSLILEGVVEEWTEARVVLRSIDGESLTIIHHPTEDILLTKVMLIEPIPEEKAKPNLTEAQEKIKSKLHEVQAEVEPELQEKNIAELRDMVKEQERQIIISKRREHFGAPGAVKRAAPYSNPLGISAYSPQPKQTSIAEKLVRQEAEILRKNFRRR
jgi:hypothetical protein